MARKVKADCRADTRGGPWAGIPVCVIESAAYRDLSLWARAILVEIVARMNGWNNGSIAVSQREIAAALGLTNFRKIVTGLVELVDHGFVDVSAEGQWKERQSREYRLTFVSTKSASATNEYLHWRLRAKSGDATVAAAMARSDATVAAEGRKLDATAAARIAAHRQKSAIPENGADAAVASLIYIPYPPAAELEGGYGDDPSSTPPESLPSAAADRSGNLTKQLIEEAAATVRAALLARRASKGLLGLCAVARSAGVSVDRLTAFIEGRDGLNGPSILRLNRELRNSDGAAA